VLRDIVGRIDSLSDLINDLMVYARPRPPRMAPVDLRSLVSDAATIARRDPAWQAIGLSVEGDDVSGTVDGELIRSTLLNLFLNAAQAMGGHGSISVAIGRIDELVTVNIRDTGPGIPAALRTQVLEPFFTTKSRGGGLGLPIARRTAELHGGTLAVDCPAEGGTVVTLTLPIRGAAPDE
jgi:signal transduction histidine kinase